MDILNLRMVQMWQLERLKKIDGIIFKTNRTDYELGKVHPDYKKWAIENGYKWNDKHPIRFIKGWIMEYKIIKKSQFSHYHGGLDLIENDILEKYLCMKDQNEE